MNSFISKILSAPRVFLTLSPVQKIFIVLIFAAAGWFVYGKLISPKAAPSYQTAQVERGTLVVSVSESGQVVASNRVAITTEASGVINNVYVKDGDTVTAGETIADMTLDTDGAQHQAQAYSNYLQAQNNLNSAKAKLNSLQSALFRANQAFVNDRGIPNPSDQQKSDPKYIQENADWLQAEADYKNQQGEISAASSSLNSAWLSYQTTSPTITAPTNGVITDIVIVPGLKITNTTNSTTNTVSSSPVASIKTEGNPIISINLTEIDSTKVKAGQKATVTFDALPDTTFTGRLMGIDTSGNVSSGVTSYPATIVLDTKNDKILPNMSTTANVITAVLDNVLLVPTAAVITADGQSTVRILKNGQIQNVDVQIGESSDTQTVIKSGLAEGDMIVVGFVSAGGNTTGASTSTSPFSRSLFGGGNRTFVNVGGGGGGRTGR